MTQCLGAVMHLDDVGVSTTSVSGTSLEPLVPNDESIDSGDEPEKHVDHINPCSTLHTDDSSIALRILFDIHLAKDTKKDEEEEPDQGVEIPKHPRLDERQHPKDGEEAGEGAADDGKDPFAVRVFASLSGLDEVLRVQADDDETHDELEEAYYDA